MLGNSFLKVLGSLLLVASVGFVESCKDRNSGGRNVNTEPSNVTSDGTSSYAGLVSTSGSGYAACIGAGNSPSTCSQFPDRGTSVLGLPGYSAANNDNGYAACIRAGNSADSCSRFPDRGAAGGGGYAACIRAGNSPQSCSSFADRGPSVNQRYNSCVRNGQADAFCNQSPQSWYGVTSPTINTNNGYVACIGSGYTPNVCSQNQDRSLAYGRSGYAGCVLRGNLPAACSTNYDRGWSSNLYNSLMSTGVPLAVAFLQSIGIPALQYLQPFEVVGLGVASQTANTVTLSWFSAGGTSVSFVVARAFGKVPPANCRDGVDVAVVRPAAGAGIFSQLKFTSTGLSAGSSYSYRVCAQNGGGLLTSGITIQASTSAAAYAVNSAGGAVGGFTGDAKFVGGLGFASAIPVNTTFVVNPAPATVYRTVRYGNSSYVFDRLDGGRFYKLRMHFAEIVYNISGSRKFDVSVNGEKVISNLDIIASAGGKNIAYIREFNVPADQAGRIVVAFKGVVNTAVISGIEVIGTPIYEIGVPKFPATVASSSQFLSTASDELYVFGVSNNAKVRPWIGVSGTPTTQSFQFNRLVVGKAYALRVYPANVSSDLIWFQADVTSGQAMINNGAFYNSPIVGNFATASPWVIDFVAMTPSVTLKLSPGQVTDGTSLYFDYFDAIGYNVIPWVSYGQAGLGSSPLSADSSAEFTAVNPADSYPFAGGLLANIRPSIGYDGVSSTTQSFAFSSLQAGKTYTLRVFPASTTDTRTTWHADMPVLSGDVISGGTWKGSVSGFYPGANTPWVISFVPKTSTATITLSIDPKVAPLLAINTGGAANDLFSADVSFSGGLTFSSAAVVNTASAVSAAPMPIYQNVRYGNMSYALSGLKPAASYNVRLHFAEIFYNVANSRKFNVAINGSPVLTNFDVLVEAGGKNIAVVKEFTAQADGFGKIQVGFTNVLSTAIISGIEVYDVARPNTFLSFDYFDTFLR